MHMKKGYLLPVVVMYIFAIAASVVFILSGIQENKINKQGIPVQCEVISVEEYIRSEQDLENGGFDDVKEYETNVKYSVNGKEYIDTVSGRVGLKGESVELVYLPDAPEKVYRPSSERTTEIMNYIMIGWIVFWISMTAVLIFVFRKKKSDRRRGR